MKTTLLITLILLSSALHLEAISYLTDEEIKTILRNDSVRRYPDECPCPYSRRPDGTQCGPDNAYTQKDGPYRPYCYPENIPQHVIDQYREEYEFRNNINVIPYYAEYRDKGRIFTFKGNIWAEMEPEIKHLQIEFLENLHSGSDYYKHKLKNLGVTVTEVPDDPNIPSEKVQQYYPPEQKHRNLQ